VKWYQIIDCLYILRLSHIFCMINRYNIAAKLDIWICQAHYMKSVVKVNGHVTFLSWNNKKIIDFLQFCVYSVSLFHCYFWLQWRGEREKNETWLGRFFRLKVGLSRQKGVTVKCFMRKMSHALLPCRTLNKYSTVSIFVWNFKKNFWSCPGRPENLCKTLSSSKHFAFYLLPFSIHE